METRKNICIRCPRGCEITTTLDGSGALTKIEGNFCKLGEEYVKSEMADPRRILTTTVNVINGLKPLVPVWTEKPVPKSRMMELSAEIRKLSVEAPVVHGQVIAENLLGLGVRLLASGSTERK